MDERQLLIEELADGHRMVGAALSDLSSEVAEWQPGGTANSIASLLAHTIVGEDRVVNQMFGAGELLFVSDDWAAETGIPAENSEIWQPGWSLNLEAFDAYRREVQQSMDDLLADLDPATLDDEIEAFGSPATQRLDAEGGGEQPHPQPSGRGLHFARYEGLGRVADLACRDPR